jgi:uncharacterized protein YbaR (Trm112 family)
MIPHDLIALLCCPESRQPLAIAPDEALRSVNERIAAGLLSNRSGTPVTEPVDALLVREDGRFGYAVRDGIPVLLIEEALPL